ncbi:MAG: hypothetical protein SPD90_04225 [Intestinibacter sp.]|uniref:hypothetical protein n=1 Tax=Intestinibacter sp. TaxID=1965304 RepID=UPI002A83994C|nr:hypothetical protein [Intestinibacter sp.]MDY4574244.1 hypothetical protein [Intestinibacter sp.]
MQVNDLAKKEDIYLGKKIIDYLQGVNYRQVFFILCIDIFIFQNLIQEIIGPFKYFDELFSVFIFPIAFLYLMLSNGRARVKKDDIIIVVLLGIITCFGLYSNFKYKYQPFSAVFQDILLVWKFYLAYFTSKVLFASEMNGDRIKSILNINCKIITLVLFALTCLDYVFHIFRTQIRYGLRSLYLFYSHPTFVAGVCICLLALIVYSEVKKSKVTYLYLGMLLIMITLTLRSKAIVMAVIIVISYIYMMMFSKKISIGFWFVIAALGIFLAYDQISYYFFDLEDGARQQLLRNSFYIARDYFPFGTGFGTYGSHPSKEMYSPVYYIYGLNKIWGLGEVYNFFISDNFWPMILGQLGYLGLLGYSAILLIFFKKIQRAYNRKNNRKYFAAMMLFCYLLIASTSESAFVHTYAVMFSLIFGILV